MEVMLTKRNQITIPKSLITKLNTKPGDMYDIEIVDNKITLTLISNNNNKQKSNTETKSSNIISNIEDIGKYSKPKLSPCNLIVRSKKSYIKQFCDKCKGQLVENDSAKQCMCEYYKSTVSPKQVSKVIINELMNNVNKLNQSIDNTINTIEASCKKEDNIIADDNKHHKADTTMQYVKLDDYKKCKHCGEFFKSGILLDEVFHCINCAKEDFKKFYKKFKEEK